MSQVYNYHLMRRAEWYRGCELLVCKVEDGKCFEADLTWREVSPNSYYTPTARLETTQAQALMDSLWECGIRPTEGAGSAGAMAATQKHLEDMRRLVFDELPSLRRNEAHKSEPANV